MTKNKGQHISADSFTLVGQNGKPRVSLWMEPQDDVPRLSFFDENGNERIVIRVGKGSVPGINILRGDGSTAIRACQTDSDSFELVLNHGDGSPAIQAAVKESGVTQVEIFDKAGTSVWKPQAPVR